MGGGARDAKRARRGVQATRVIGGKTVGRGLCGPVQALPVLLQQETLVRAANPLVFHDVRVGKRSLMYFAVSLLDVRVPVRLQRRVVRRLSRQSAAELQVGERQFVRAARFARVAAAAHQVRSEQRQIGLREWQVAGVKIVAGDR